MKRSFFPFFLQTIRIHYQDPELAFYTKGVLGLLWLVQLPVALWYGAPAQFYALLGAMLLAIGRSEERRVGKECLRLCRSRWSPYH